MCVYVYFFSVRHGLKLAHLVFHGTVASQWKEVTKQVIRRVGCNQAMATNKGITLRHFVTYSNYGKSALFHR